MQTIPSLQVLSINTSSSAGAIDYYGDADWWKVTLTYGYSYQIWLRGADSGNGTLVDPFLKIYNSIGVFQYSATDDVIQEVIRDSYTLTTPNSTGIFFLSAEAYNQYGVGSYTILILIDQIASTATAAKVNFNSISEVGYVGDSNDVSDWYGVTLQAGVLYQFDMIGSADDGALSGLTLIDPELTLRNNQGAQLISNDDSGIQSNARIFYTPPTTGTYFLDAHELGNNALGTYKIIVNAAPTDAALTLGAVQSGSINFFGDINLHSVILTAGVAYGFSITGSSLTDPYLEFLSSTGEVIANDDDSGSGLNAYISYTPTTTGTYYLAARESGNNATGSYSVLAWQLPSISIANATVTEADTGTTNLAFTLSLSAVSPVDISVSVATNGTATATYSVDYIPDFRIITIAAGQTSTSYTVQVLGDSNFEPTEALHVLLSNPINSVLGKSDAYGYIVDNDKPYVLPNEPYLTSQWYLYPTTGINVFPVWRNYTGAGVRVAVFDQGIDPLHPELDGKLLLSLGRNASNLTVGGNPVLSTDNHGTSVAGVIAAELNGVGVVGVGYGAELISIYSPLSYNGMSIQIANAYTYAANFDILNDSWRFANGFASGTTWAFYDDFQSFTFLDAGVALANLAAIGRRGLGTVVVQSAGNSFSVGDDTNLHNFQNSQYIITVAATDYFGNVTNYSSPGASILVAAPGGGNMDKLSDILTTDRVGTAGNDSSNYSFIAGTSFSAPIVSGIVALMLEANPNLGYRDVQEILAYSAREIGSSGNDWRYNGASNWNGGGLHYDAIEHNLGFGLVDALAAVRLAETWSGPSLTTANRQQVSLSHNVGLVIPDSTGNSAYDGIYISQSIDIERVEVTLNVTHPFVGDLSVLLTSPNLTTSSLLWRPQQNSLSAFGTAQDNIHFTFDTVLNWGENSVGLWRLSIYDHEFEDVGTFDSWTLNLIGKPVSVDDTYIYTSEFAEATTDDPGRSILNDTGGMDTLNAAAVSTNSVLNLMSGGASTIDGRSLTIAASTVIENAYGGDGNDTITGNSGVNKLFGMRGNDIIAGGSGDDSLSGGENKDVLNGDLGNDTLIGGNDDDYLTGGDGTDTAFFSGVLTDYNVVYDAENLVFIISDKVFNRDGTDVVASLERFQFADVTRVAADFADTSAPTVTAFSPTDGATAVLVGANIVVTFSEAIQKGTGNIVLKDAANNVVATYDAVTSTNLSISGSTLTINPTADLGYSTNYFVTFASGTIKDLVGNSYTGITTYDFTTAAAPDTTAPTVSTFSPTDGATAVLVGANIVVTFSEAIQKGTGNIVLKDAANNVVATYDAATSTNLSISGSTLTINPTADLGYSTNYFVTFASGTIKDLVGNSYTGITTYDFTTAAAPDTTAPTVSTFSPTDGATAVLVGANIVVTFSEAIQKGTGNIVLKDAANNVVATYDAATSTNLSISGSTLTINPTADLGYSTNYFVTFASGTIKDLAGNSYTGITTYDFTTAAAVVIPLVWVGTTGVDTFIGSSAADTITGGGGVDKLDGKGDSDLYIIAVIAEHSAAEVTDTGTSGTDELRFISTTASTLNLFAGDTGLEQVTIGTGTGTSAVTTGTAALNLNAAAVLNALIIQGNDGINTLTGTAYADTINGGGGNDVISGGAGNDALTGGLGADKFTVASGTDTILDLGQGGADVLIVSAGATANATIHSAWTATSASVNSGSEFITTNGIAVNLSKVFTGNGFTLTNVGGATTLIGSGLADTITGAAGADILTGGAGNDSLQGSDGSDVLTGGLGADVMNGGNDSDLYIVAAILEHSAAEVTDSGNTGTDELRFTSTTASTLNLFAGDTGLELVSIGTGTGATALSTGTKALNINAAAVLNGLTLVGNSGVNTLTGTDYSDKIYGNAGNDVISGGAGSDCLCGGLGNDSLSGGDGQDFFVFDTTPSASTNKDTLVDFLSGVDKIQLSKTVFKSLSLTDALNAADFFASSSAVKGNDTSDRVVYNTTTGALYFDSDGSGSTAAVQIAVIGSTTHPQLVYSDFLFIL